MFGKDVFRQSLCQIAQMFLFLPMRKIRDPNLSKKLEAPCVLGGRWFCPNCFTEITEIEEQENANMDSYLIHMHVVAGRSFGEAMDVGVGCLFHVLRTVSRT